MTKLLALIALCPFYAYASNPFQKSTDPGIQRILKLDGQFQAQNRGTSFSQELRGSFSLWGIAAGLLGIGVQVAQHHIEVTEHQKQQELIARQQKEAAEKINTPPLSPRSRNALDAMNNLSESDLKFLAENEAKDNSDRTYFRDKYNDLLNKKK